MIDGSIVRNMTAYRQVIGSCAVVCASFKDPDGNTLSLES